MEIQREYLYGTTQSSYWGSREIFWTKGYFVSSIGNVRQDTIKHYIEDQG